MGFLPRFLLASRVVPHPLQQSLNRAAMSSIFQEMFEQAMQLVNQQIHVLDRALNACIALAEAKVFRLRLLRDTGT